MPTRIFESHCRQAFPSKWKTIFDLWNCEMIVKWKLFARSVCDDHNVRLAGMTILLEFGSANFWVSPRRNDGFFSPSNWLLSSWCFFSWNPTPPRLGSGQKNQNSDLFLHYQPGISSRIFRIKNVQKVGLLHRDNWGSSFVMVVRITEVGKIPIFSHYLKHQNSHHHFSTTKSRLLTPSVGETYIVCSSVLLVQFSALMVFTFTQING